MSTDTNVNFTVTDKFNLNKIQEDSTKIQLELSKMSKALLETLPKIRKVDDRINNNEKFNSMMISELLSLQSKIDKIEKMQSTVQNPTIFNIMWNTIKGIPTICDIIKICDKESKRLSQEKEKQNLKELEIEVLKESIKNVEKVDNLDKVFVLTENPLPKIDPKIGKESEYMRKPRSNCTIL